jgi:hypothetical protein
MTALLSWFPWQCRLPGSASRAKYFGTMSGYRVDETFAQSRLAFAGPPQTREHVWLFAACPRRAGEPGTGANVFRPPPTLRDVPGLLAQAGGSPSDSIRRTECAWHARGLGFESPAPQVRPVNRKLSHRFSVLYSTKYSSARTSAAARLFGSGLHAEYLAGPHCCWTRLSSRVASPTP